MRIVWARSGMRPGNGSGRAGHKAVCQLVQERRSITPTEAGVGNGDAVGEGDTLFPCLFSRIEVAFEHEAHDRLATLAKLSENFTGNDPLACVILVGVIVRAIDH